MDETHPTPDPDDMATYPDVCPVCGWDWQHDAEDPGTCATCGHDPNEEAASSLTRGLASLEREMRSYAVCFGDEPSVEMSRTTLKQWALLLLAARRQVNQDVFNGTYLP